mmetsp:Transcript_78488/g.190225  ORF Transcript_78488/g.190225 Transcript_78488/m.190225 type:complete len:86 (-) Transcript_78488:221-478(-)
MFGAFFDFSRLLVVITLSICTCAFLHEGTRMAYGTLEQYNPKNNPRPGFLGIAWKFARIGERLSPWVAATCVLLSFHMLFIKEDS